MSVQRLTRLSEAARESARRERLGMTPRRVTPPDLIAELERQAFGTDDAMFWRKDRELAEVEPVTYAVVVPGVHQCQRCKALLDDPRVCMDCGIFNPLERYEFPPINRGPLG